MSRNTYEELVGMVLRDKVQGNWDYEPYYFEVGRKVRGGVCLSCGGEVEKLEKYLPDYICEASKLIVEAKGKFVSKNRTKMLDFIEQHPDYTLVMCFMSDNLLEGQNKKKWRYSDWCNKHGIEYVVARTYETLQKELTKKIKELT